MTADLQNSVLGRTARAFAPMVVECGEELATLYERAITGAPADGPCAARDELAVESIFLVLHLTDRVSREKLGFLRRALFMKELLEGLSEQVPEESLRQGYAAVQQQYGRYKKLLPDAGEPLAGTLCWEVGKSLGVRFARANPVTITLLATVTAQGFQLVSDTFDAATPR
jgi:hypothetical protein